MCNTITFDFKEILQSTCDVEYKRECPQCNNIINYSTKHGTQAFRRATKNNSKCNICVGKNNSDRVIIPIDGYKRNCPDCDVLLIYSGQQSRNTYLTAMKENSKCKVCGNKKYNENEPKWEKICDLCGHLQKYSSRVAYPKALKFNRVCRNCANEGVQKSVNYKRKPYVLPTGDVVNVQGYEPLTLDKLLKEENVSLEFLKIKHEDKPRIQYEYHGKKSWYYPDAYISNTNTIVETKCGWTFERNKEKNTLKFEACKQRGFNVRLLVWDGKKNLTKDILW
jgi:hypothetical protein